MLRLRLEQEESEAVRRMVLRTTDGPELCVLKVAMGRARSDKIEDCDPPPIG